MMNGVPMPSWLSTSIVPSYLVTVQYTIFNPSPIPSPSPCFWYEFGSWKNIIRNEKDTVKRKERRGERERAKGKRAEGVF
jgi:hypothetical protein